MQMTREEARKRAEELMEKMTLEEKCSQLRYDAPAVKRLGIPAYNWWNEGLHGVARSGQATVFPQAIALAASFDTELLHDVAEVIATEGRAKYNENVKQNDRDIYKGLTFWSPNVNIFRDPRWGRGHETYGEDPYLTGEMASAMVTGIQSQKIGATVKHFACNNKETNRKNSDSRVSERAIREIYLKAFEIIVKKADPWAIMSSYNLINGHRASENKDLLTGILRDEWGFQGLVTTDWWTKGEHYKETLAGNDIKMGTGYPERLMEALEKGLITRKDLEVCVERVLKVLMRAE